MKITQLNHVAIHVRDVKVSSQFYREVLELEPMSRPAFSFDGTWFRIGLDQELHLIASSGEDTISPPSERHFAMKVDSIEDAAARLRDRAVEFRGPKQRPDGAWQIFLRDPDGHVLELFQPAPASE